MKRLALLSIVLMAVLAVPAFADSQVMGSGYRSPSGTSSTSGQVVGSGGR